MKNVQIESVYIPRSGKEIFANIAKDFVPIPFPLSFLLLFLKLYLLLLTLPPSCKYPPLTLGGIV